MLHTGTVVSRRVLGNIAFCNISGREEQIVFKKEQLLKESEEAFPKSKSKLPIGWIIEVLIDRIEEEDVVLQWKYVNKNNTEILATSSNPTLKICRKWSLNKPCNSKCKYRHYFINQQEHEAAERLKATRKEFILRDAKLNAQYHSKDPHNHKEHKAKRASILVDWIIRKFGPTALTEGRGVLDIAGGAGKVAKAFKMNNIECTVIDPKIRKKQKKMETNGTLEFTQIQDFFSYEWVLQSEENCNLIKNSSLLVGLHPDQPTVDIVRVAIHFEKPFVVVPCCVFTNLFPDRQLSDGSSVNTTNELCLFIQQMNENIKCDYLPFTGRNKICYRQYNHTETNG